MSYGGVYAITDTVSGKRYVGSSKNVSQRLGYHRSCLRKGTHFNPMLQKAYSARPDAFTFAPLAYLEPCEQLPTEQRLLDDEHAKGRGTFNIAKEAVAFMKGRKHAPETLEAMSKSRIGNKSRTGVPSHWKGKKLSPEHVANVAAAKRNPSPETREKMRQAKLGKAPASKGRKMQVCGRGHSVTGANVYVRPDRGTHVCRECLRINQIDRKRGTQNPGK